MLASVASHLRTPGAVAAQTHCMHCAQSPPRPTATECDPATHEAACGGLAIVATTHGGTDTHRGLSMEETREYERHGLVVPAVQLSPGATAALQKLLVRTLAVTLSADPPVEMPIAPNCPTNLYGAHGPAIPADVASKWMALCRHPAILDRVQSVLGPDIILWGSQLFHKPAETGLEVPWQYVEHTAVHLVAGACAHSCGPSAPNSFVPYPPHDSGRACRWHSSLS